MCDVPILSTILSSHPGSVYVSSVRHLLSRFLFCFCNCVSTRSQSDSGIHFTASCTYNCVCDK